MRRIFTLTPVWGACFSSWDDGTEGYDWKARALAEKRSVALEFLGNVNKRVSIHDAIRLKADINKKAIHGVSMPTLFTRSDNIEDDELSDVDYNSLLEMIEGEIDTESMAYLSPSDVTLLREEFLNGDDPSDCKRLLNWSNLRSSMSDYQNYGSIPAGERNRWSAWYLRNVRSCKKP
uniref:Uncharacterized protein n=1 Tax=Trypanosoma congolense (strain IL3000) TaxID=1068625 RepID=G0UX31_TRYCI|nr:conserved hypothetical protein [Trypanosoma congolense IL3000]